MTDNRVVIRYDTPVDRGVSGKRRFAGETYTVADAAAAESLHPKATIVGYADGRKFVRAQDDSLAAVREAEAKAAEREAARAAKTTEKAPDAPKADAKAEAKAAG